MPENATLAQRVTWHLAHAAACACREMPRSVQKELARRRLRKRRVEVYADLSSEVARQLKRRKITEGDVLRDFHASRKKRTARPQG
jgi:diphthamide synthase (EF-2-diphthine--ammonia ligase)